MPNQIRFPYGDAFLVNTPNIDQLGQHIYQQELQRKQYQQQQDKMLDDNFSKELVNIKKADIPDVVNAWNDFKQAKMNSYKMGNKINQGQQYDILQKRANVESLINGSIEHKEFLKNQALAQRQDKKGIYADDAAEKITQMLNTPTSKIDRSKDSELMYPYSIPDLNKELDVARGKGSEKDVTIKVEPNKTDKFKDDIHTLKVGNNPNQFFNSLGQSIITSNKKKPFTLTELHKYDDQQLQDLEDRYNTKVSDPSFISAYGKQQPLSATDTPFGQALKIATMEEYVNKDLTPKITSKVNEERKIADSHEFARQQQARSINAAIQRQRIGFNHTDAKDASKQHENNQWIDSFIDDGIEKSKNYPLIDGVRTVPLDVVSGKAFQKGQIPAIALSISEDGQTFTPLYPTYDATGNPTSTPNPALSQPMDRSGIKLGLGYKTVTKKDLGNVMNSGSDKDVKVQIGGKIYKIPKSNLTKMDSDKVKYKVIE